MRHLYRYILKLDIKCKRYWLKEAKHVADVCLHSCVDKEITFSIFKLWSVLKREITHVDLRQFLAFLSIFYDEIYIAPQTSLHKWEISIFLNKSFYLVYSGMDAFLHKLGIKLVHNCIIIC